MTCSWNLSRSSHFLNLSWNHFLKVFSIAVATCNYIRYGRGGGQEIKNAICVLGLNMINDKVLLFIIFLYPHIFNSLYLYILMHISPYPRFSSYTHISGVCHPMALALHPHLCRVEQVSFYPFLVIILISFPCYHMYPWSLISSSSLGQTGAADSSWYPEDILPLLSSYVSLILGIRSSCYPHVCRVKQVSCYPFLLILMISVVRSLFLDPWYPHVVHILLFAGSNRCGRFILISWRVNGGIFLGLASCCGPWGHRNRRRNKLFPIFQDDHTPGLFLCFQFPDYHLPVSRTMIFSFQDYFPNHPQINIFQKWSFFCSIFQK